MESKKINQLATNVAPVTTDLTIIGDPITGVSKKVTLLQLASLFSGSIAFFTNYSSFPATGEINTIYCAKDTQKLYLWSGSAYVETFPSQAILNTYQLLSAKGAANGYASLDSGGKVPVSQLPSSIMEYKGMWDASTNTPTLANGTGDTGDVYICNVAGSVNFGAGVITFAVGDYVIYSGSIWQRSSGAVGTVTSVAALTLGTTGTDVSSSVANATTTPVITLNIPNASATARGLITTGSQTIAGSKTFSSTTLLNSVYIDGVSYLKNLTTTSYIAGYTTFSAKANGVIEYFFPSSFKSVLDFNDGGDYTYTFPNASGTIALLEGSQTFSGAKTFSSSIFADGSILLKNNVTSWQTGYVNLGGIATGYGFSVGLPNGGSPLVNELRFNSSAAYNYTFPAATGTIALTSNLSSYVPYTGATASVNLGAFGITASSLLVSNNSTFNSNLLIKKVGLAVTTPTYVTQFAASSGVGIGYSDGTGGANFILQTASIYDYTFPAATGTLALTSDLGSYVPTTRTISTTAPLQGGGDLSANRTLSITQATTSTNGYLSSTDWNTFNGKQNALTNPVTGTGTTNYHAKFTGTNTIGNSLIWDNGTNVGINTTSPFAIADTNFTVNGTTSAAIQLGYNGTRYGQFYTDSGEIRLSAVANLPLTFYSNNLERMRISASGNVGIGTSPVSTNLIGSITSVKSYNGDTPTSTTAQNYYLNQSNLYLFGRNAGLTMVSNANEEAIIAFANPYSAYIGGIRYDMLADATGGSMKFQVGGTNERMRITSGGVVCVGTTAGFTSGLVCSDGGTSFVPFAAKVGTTANATQVYFNNPNGVVGSITTSGSATAYNTGSDYRLKQDFKDFNGIDLISEIKVYDFEFKSDNTRMYGVKAHELAEVIPYIVQGEKDGENMQSVDYSKLTPILVKAIQEQQATITSLQEQINELKNK